MTNAGRGGAGRKHIVVPGDCLASIGAFYGFDWRTLWAHAANAGLRARRKDPNVLHPGDVVVIPDKEVREEPRPTDARHRFVIKGRPETLRLRLLNEMDHPMANLSYALVCGGQTLRGTTSAEGELKENIPPLEKEARLFLDVGDQPREITLRLGGLDPIDEVSGVQSRLANLGYDPGRADGILGPRTHEALREFQQQYALPVTGEMDPATLARLKDRHGH